MDNTLRLENVAVTIRNKTLLHPTTWTAHPGQISAILGPNGAGKSTLLKAAAGILPHTGRILIGETSTAELPREALARRLAWVPQESTLRTPMTVRDLVAQGRFAHLGPLGRLTKNDHAAVDAALEAVSVGHLAHRNWMFLSGGERRRVMVARGLATGARTLMLDEPTASLDIEHALRMMDLMKQLALDGFTVVSVLHDLDLAAQYAQHLLIVRGGHPAYAGSPEDVLTADTIADVYRVDILPNAGPRFALRGDA